MNFVSNLSVRNKLILLSAIPLAGLLYYLQINIRQELANKNTAQQVIQDVLAVEELSKVVHEFQKERALSLTFLAGADADMKREILEQRESTDKAVFSLEKVLKEQQRVIAHYGLMDSLVFVRAKVNALRPVGEIDPFYRDIKSTLLDGVSDILRSSKTLTLKNHFEEHLFLLYSKEFLAQTRSELATVLATGSFGGTSYGNFASGKGKHDVNLAKFKKIASPELKDFFDRKYQGPLVHQTYEIINAAFFNQALHGFPYTYDTWWNVATSSINALKEVEDYSSYLIKQRATEQLDTTTARVTQNLIIAFLIIAMISAVVLYTLRGIVSAISSIKNAADRMAKGEVDIVLDITNRDEIGALAASFNEMITVTRKFSDIANTIGKGDYSPVVDVRGTADTLGIALNQMKNNLQKLSHENEIRTWMLTGISQLNDSMRGEKM